MKALHTFFSDMMNERSLINGRMRTWDSNSRRARVDAIGQWLERAQLNDVQSLRAMSFAATQEASDPILQEDLWYMLHMVDGTYANLDPRKDFREKWQAVDGVTPLGHIPFLHHAFQLRT